ncbi:hypothetical protein [Flagellimonas meridianipacifica]|uniref:GDSL-like lipase/acylhydrolase family protein n=1 Tax=Flagellimonas meridianipacifica TaxID=1080225 RepID=A0A2T0MCQ9_9FLAO|nr:hypothetical protein [Allomuricauda pacifica]PRX55274.1 hypothetical protein CLV81_3683 [Allomuricauda pacifica]
MKQFLIKIIVFASFFWGLYLLTVVKLSDGFVDMYYPKFTQEAGSLVLGLSRADQGIDPVVLEETLEPFQINKPIINFATNQSFYGEVYLEAIQKKLAKNTTNGIFILSVSPGSFTGPKNMGPKKIRAFDERMVIGKTDNFTTSPNYNYIINCYGQSLYNSIYNTNTWGHLVSHDNGWNQVKLIAGKDTIKERDIANWKSENLIFYNKKSQTESFKDSRFEQFLKTISFLKKKGKVFLVRIPADPDVLAFENSRWSDFDSRMERVANTYNIPYLNYSKQTSAVKTYDGSHMESNSAKKFTKMLAERIANKL